MTAGCRLVTFLQAAGPARVPLRECCLPALLGGSGSTQPPACASAAPPPVPTAPASCSAAPPRAPVLTAAPPGLAAPAS